ncbi:MAG: DNA-directed RNA polymerase subunit beta, partial [Elusimicrobiota bacterium]|nr:DNA-directed RNA polymerase subunit beta [Elusimicrobiota bacterium]
MKQVNFAKFFSPINLPNLLDLPKNSYREFLQEESPPEKRKLYGLQQAFLDVFGDINQNEGIENAAGSLKLQYLYYNIEKPKYTPEECKAKGLTYSVGLKATFRLLQKLESGKIKEFPEQEVYLCDLPYMTESGSFVINGAERVIVTQIHRSPGVVFDEQIDPKGDKQLVSHLGKPLYTATIIPYRGAWLEFEFDLSNALFVHINKRRKIPATTLLRAIGIETDEEILELFYEIEEIQKSKFDTAVGKILAEDIVNKDTGEVIKETLQEIRPEDLQSLKNIEKLKVIKFHQDLNDLTIFYTLRVDPTKSRKDALNYIYKILRTPELIPVEVSTKYLENLLFRVRRYDLTHVGRYKLIKKFKEIFAELEKNTKYNKFGFKIPKDTKRTLTIEDIIATIKYVIALNNGLEGYEIDDVDHLGNRRVRAVGELLENQFRIGLLGVARLTRERMNQADKKSLLTPRTLINPTPLVMCLRRFFYTSQLSQFLDQTNPLAELTHKRRLSALGPGGLHRKRAGFEVRDVHYTHYGRICPIETPEGPNIGLITSIASFSRINHYGLIETPYCKVENGRVLAGKIEYLTADKEDEFVIAQANVKIDRSGRIVDDLVACRHKDDMMKLLEPKKVDYIEISPMQVFSVSTSLIPFLEHDDANRALMGSNMQRQALPLLITEPPFVGTGIEKKVAVDSYAVVVAKRPGEVIHVACDEIGIFSADGEVDIYHLRKYNRSNQDTC